MRQETTQKIRAFLARQRVAAPISGGSALSFALLAEQMQRGELIHFDTAGTHWVTQFRGEFDLLMLGLTRFGASTVLFAVATLIVIILARRQRGREASFLAIAGLGTLCIDELLKLYFQRPRPTPPFLVAPPTSFSFPSGHAMGATCIYLSLLVLLFVLRVPKLYRGLGLALAIALTIGVGLSRVYLGVHYPSDVLGGVLIGVAWTTGVAGFFYPCSRQAEEPASPQ